MSAVIVDRVVVDPALWKVILGCALAAYTGFVYRRTFPPIGPARTLVLAALRILAFACLIVFVLDPALISVSRVVTEPIVLVLLDSSKSMRVEDMPEGSRFEKAVEEIEHLSRMIPRTPDARFEVVPFSNELAPAPVPIDSLTAADGEGTDILGAVTTALERYRASNLAAIILLSDGRVSRGMTTSGSRLSVPLFTVGFGDTLEETDIAVQDVVYPRITYTHAETAIEAVYTAVGCAGREVVVRLEQDGRVEDEERVRIGDRTREFGVSFNYVPGGEGDKRLTIRAVPFKEEQWRDNNSESITITVLKEKIRFLFLDRHADWNATFLRDLVRRTLRFETEIVTFRTGKGLVTVPDGRAWTFPAEIAGLRRFDLVIVADDAGMLASSSSSEMIVEYARSGGSVLVLADENSPLQWDRSMRHHAGFLPFGPSGAAAVRTGEFMVREPAGAPGNPVAKDLAGTDGLDELPPLLAAVSGLSVSAGADVVLVLSDGSAEMPFLVTQRYGDGLTAAVLGFPLWRWKLSGTGDRSPYDSFFGSLIQYLAEGADMPGLEIGADRTVYRLGDRVRFTVHTADERVPETVRGDVLRIEGEREDLVRTFLFEPEPRQIGTFKAELGQLPPGRYRIVASVAGKGGRGSSGDVTISVEPVSVEVLNRSRDNGFLRYCARISGGRYVEAGAIVALWESMALEPKEVLRRDVRTLRKTPLLFLGIVFLLAVEWILRKVWGLV